MVQREAARFNVLACGRRWGKTVMGVDRLIDAAMQGKPTAWFGPTYKMLAEVWRDVERATAPVVRRVNRQQNRLELVSGGVIEMWSLDTLDPARGRKYGLIVIDEAAMIAGLQYVWQAVIRPTLTDYKGGAWFLSTPRGMNFFRQMYHWGQDPLRPEWRSWRMPTTSNPYIDPVEVEAARLDLPERIFAQEYLAEFLESAGGVFRKVRAAITAERVQPYQGRFVAALDWAQQNDFTVIVVMDANTRHVVDIDRFNQIDWALQRGRIHAMADKWKLSTIVTEINSIGSPNFEALQRERLPVVAFETTSSSKPPLIESLALAFEREEIKIPDDPTLIGELEAYERTVSEQTGRPRYHAPEGFHDDMVMALALAWHGITNVYRGRLVF